jgi:ABC-type dipeptide/oligopeptide/nickel transport system ATPase component
MPLDNEKEDTKITKLDKRLFGHPFRCVIVGSSGGGKSSFLYSLLNDKKMYADFFDKVLIWNGSPRYNSQFKKLKNVEVYNSFDPEEIKDIVSEIRIMQEECDKKLKECAKILKKTTSEISKLDDQHPEYQKEYEAKYKSALDAIGGNENNNKMIEYMK